MLQIFQGEEISHTANDLRSVIRQCIQQWQPLIAQKECRLSVDLSNSMPVLCQAEDTHSLLDGMFDLAVSRLATGDELSVIGCRALGSVDLEIADSGAYSSNEYRYDRLAFPPRSLCNRRLTVLQNCAVSFGGRVWATTCPQGGVAWTLRLPSRVTTKRAA